MLWIDKHRPRTLATLSYQPVLTSRLSSLSTSPALPHLLFYGPPGSGKKTRISAFLHSLFGSGAEKVKLEQRTFKVTTNGKTKKEIDVNMLSSSYHIEINPGESGLDDRYVVQEVIKEIAASGPIFRDNSSSNGGEGNGINFKVVVLMEVDRLSKQAQAALRRTMEKYSHSCRLILCCTNQSKVIDPIRSRCLGIRVKSPTVDEIASCLTEIARKERVEIPAEVVAICSKGCTRNMRRAMLMLEAWRVQSGGDGGGGSSSVIQKTDWEQYISSLAKDITTEQSPQKLLIAREKLYELLINCIPPDVILKTLTMELIGTLDDSLKGEVVGWAAFYDHRLSQGSKDIFHLEAFVAKFMQLYKSYLTNMFG